MEIQYASKIMVTTYYLFCILIAVPSLFAQNIKILGSVAAEIIDKSSKVWDSAS